VVCERIIKDRLYNFVSPYLDSAQHGFLPGRSTLTNLSLLLSDATQSLSNNTQLDVIYLDLSKDFDRIDCNLLYKLTHQFNIHALIASTSALSLHLPWVALFSLAFEVTLALTLLKCIFQGMPEPRHALSFPVLSRLPQM